MSDDSKLMLLTGASRGIGHATVQIFVRRGWRLLTCSRDAPPAECLRDPDRAWHISADLSDPKSLDAFIDEANEWLGDRPLHALVNNAGWSPKSSFKERLGVLNGDLEAWHRVFEVNFFAPLKLARGFAASLHKGKGAIVNITSIAGHEIHPFAGSAYSTSKAALSALTREMANEFAELGVRVNAVAPGEIETAMLSPETEVLIPRIPLQKLGQPKDVAGAIYYLCSEDSEYVTGTEIFVTGGQHIL
ncbi:MULTISPECIES: SDR family NAD(P)-dependent oxidoreductase [Thalassobaculum]|uniref:NAD(P)-dependent dehydrogenase, short-chain alcohol dehydrogenase family n=1 Tax=Thalassobaculum litoreum DSM 18839 TaxID=1123362 RepID=A0A8G2BIH1_9PROT|nr:MULTISPECIES: SDR family oxidoreductase [Thalassobaculum]SDF88647.1 NAD(P)-dependent dehydrogenase, short-chain alcohol dehydrogenase family [Thalassobaculum litoreum DSM 18839]